MIRTATSHVIDASSQLDGVTVSKWDNKNGREVQVLAGTGHGVASNKWSKSNPCMCAEILGEWRKKIVTRTRDGKEIRIITATFPTEYRIYTLTHDPIYRLGVEWQNVAYIQPAHTGFFLGHGTALLPPRPNTTTERARRGEP